MLAVGMAALLIGSGGQPLRMNVPVGTMRPVVFRIGPKPTARPAYRATPILDALVAAPRVRGHGRHSELQLANLTFAVESRRRSHGDRIKAFDGFGGQRGPRLPTWRDAKELAFAVAVDWKQAGGRWRVGGGIDRLTLASTTLGGGRTGAAIKVVALDYIADDGWSLGAGWRATDAPAQARDGGRLAALALGAPPTAAGAFLHGTVSLTNRSSLSLEGAIARLAAQDARLFDGVADRRATLAFRQAF